MPRFFSALAFILLTPAVSLRVQAQAQSQTAAAPAGHYMFAWSGDSDHKVNDFLAVIDADPASPTYGTLLTTLPTDQQTVRVHHTEYVMPASAMLFANDHDAGRTFIFDLRDPLHPKTAASFTDMDGYMHPHSYARLPNGNVLATFQHTHHGAADASTPATGGIVEIDDQGKVIRSSSNADPAFTNSLLTPYSLVILPAIDRIVTTNSSMHDAAVFLGVTYQLWRLSDLKLLKTAYLDVGENRYAQISPEEPRLAPDGSVFIQTLACGLERITGIADANPKSQLVYTFPGNWCGVPTIVGHYLIQSVQATNGLIAVDIANPAKPVEVSRLKLGDDYVPHWTGWDAKTQRLVVTCSGIPGDRRLYMVKFDQTTGALSIDEAFHDAQGKPGFDFTNRQWPHAWTGTAIPHGVVFSR